VLTRRHQIIKETTHLEFVINQSESQMNEITQTQINLGDYSKPQEQTKAVGIGKIVGKIINIKKTFEPIEVNHLHIHQRMQ